MLPTKEISRIVQERFDAYASGQAGRVMALYTDDVRYWDTQAGVAAQAKADLGRYLGGLLRDYDFRYAILEEHRLEGRDAAIVLWECAVRRRAADGQPEAVLLLRRGMNLIEVQQGQVSRDESYMDLATIDALPRRMP